MTDGVLSLSLTKLLATKSPALTPLFIYYSYAFFFVYLEVYASREKNGVYMPKERYYQEESERKVLSLLVEETKFSSDLSVTE